MVSAGDTQVYGLCRPSATLEFQNSISTCVDDVARWMRSNRLQLNTVKSEVLWSTSSRRLHLLPVSPIRVRTDQVMPVSVVRNLGIYMDADVSMRSHVSKTVAACFAILRQLRSIRRSVPRSVLQSLVLSLVLQRLDYGNATLTGIPSHLIKRVQSVLVSAAWLVFPASRYVRITPLLTVLLFWYTYSYTRQLRRTLLWNSISHLLTRLASVSALHRHHRLWSHAPVF